MDIKSKAACSKHASDLALYFNHELFSTLLQTSSIPFYPATAAYVLHKRNFTFANAHTHTTS